MSSTSRDRLLRLVRRNDADLAEAALLCQLEAEPHLDVEVALLRIDALADGLRSRGFVAGAPTADVERLATYLAHEQGFHGDTRTYNDPDNALLTRVLDRKRGLPITLTILYVAIARRLHVPAYPVNLPGHMVAAIGGSGRPVVFDPFHGGMVLDERMIGDRVAAATGGQAGFRRSMVRPSPAVEVVRRLLNNLTRDLVAANRPHDALWTVELKLLLPNRVPDDHRIHGELLGRLGRFDAAGDAYEAYLEVAAADATDRDAVRRAAIQSRARLN